MNAQTFEAHLAAELLKFGCEYHITREDILREFEELDIKAHAAMLDPEDLALVIIDRLNEAGFLELVHTAVRTAVTDLLYAKEARHG